MASFKWKPHGAHLAGAGQESSRYVYIHPLNASLCVRSRWRNHILTASARDLHLHTTDMNDNIHRPGQKARSCDPRGQKPGLGWVRDVELSECMDEILQKLWALVKNIIFPNSPQAWLLYFSLVNDGKHVTFFGSTAVKTHLIFLWSSRSGFCLLSARRFICGHRLFHPRAPIISTKPVVLGKGKNVLQKDFQGLFFFLFKNCDYNQLGYVSVDIQTGGWS